MKSIGLVSALSAAFLSAPVVASSFSNEELCKAAISLEMARPVKTMAVERPGEIPQISYTRPDGGSFLYRCKFSGDRIIWATYFTETRSWGRWREDPLDGVLTYRVEGNQLTVHSSETGMRKTFAEDDF